MLGKCLCGEVQFEILEEVRNFYRCHCTLCQKQTGASANVGTFIHKDSIKWLSGKDKLTTYTKLTGFRTNFCSCCGSPVPNPLRTSDQYWIPVGLLEDTGDRKVVVHLCTSTKPGWENIPDNEKQFSDLPDFDELNSLLNID